MLNFSSSSSSGSPGTNFGTSISTYDSWQGDAQILIFDGNFWCCFLTWGIVQPLVGRPSFPIIVSFWSNESKAWKRHFPPFKISLMILRLLEWSPSSLLVNLPKLVESEIWLTGKLWIIYTGHDCFCLDRSTRTLTVSGLFFTHHIFLIFPFVLENIARLEVLITCFQRTHFEPQQNLVWRWYDNSFFLSATSNGISWGIQPCLQTLPPRFLITPISRDLPQE